MENDKELKFVMAFDVIDNSGKSVMDGSYLNAIFVDIQKRFSRHDERWGLPLLLGLYAKHIATLPEFKSLFPWYHSSPKGVEEPDNNNDHKVPDTPFEYRMGRMKLSLHPDKQIQIAIADSIPTGFPL